MTRYYLSLGSNIDSEKNIRLCLDRILEKFRVLSASAVYETDPVGPSGKNKFLNAAVGIETALAPDVLRKELRKIEEGLGRRRVKDNKFAPRVIDIDLLPQADYQRQAFIMVPLSEIAPEDRDGETGKTFLELAAALGKSFKKVGGNVLNE